MSISYLEAIREAQSLALKNDENVFIYGQDIGAFGGAFKATKGLFQKYPDRVIDAPISEDAMVGLAVGAAIEGMRPIIEMQFADFSSVGFNQIVNQAATFLAHFCTMPDNNSITIWRNSRKRTFPQPMHGNNICSLSWHHCHDSSHSGRRIFNAIRGNSN